MKLQQGYYIEPRKDKNMHLSLNGLWDFCWTDSVTEDVSNLNGSLSIVGVKS